MRFVFGAGLGEGLGPEGTSAYLFTDGFVLLVKVEELIVTNDLTIRLIARKRNHIEVRSPESVQGVNVKI